MSKDSKIKFSYDKAFKPIRDRIPIPSQKFKFSSKIICHSIEKWDDDDEAVQVVVVLATKIDVVISEMKQRSKSVCCDIHNNLI